MHLLRTFVAVVAEITQGPKAPQAAPQSQELDELDEELEQELDDAPASSSSSVFTRLACPTSILNAWSATVVGKGSGNRA